MVGWFCIWRLYLLEWRSMTYWITERDQSACNSHITKVSLGIFNPKWNWFRRLSYLVRVGCQPYVRMCFWFKSPHCVVWGKIASTVEILFHLLSFWYHRDIFYFFANFCCSFLSKILYKINLVLIIASIYRHCMNVMFTLDNFHSKLLMHVSMICVKIMLGYASSTGSPIGWPQVFKGCCCLYSNNVVSSKLIKSFYDWL